MSKHVQCCRLAVIFGMFATSAACPDEVSGQQPDAASLVRAGRETSTRLQQQAASWSAITHLPNDAHVVVSIRATPDMRRTIVSVHMKERKLGELTIIARDGMWYVSELGRLRKCRPFEAPFLLNSAYMFLLGAEPRFISEDATNSLGKYEGTKNGIATYRTPLLDTARKQLEYSIDGLEKLGRQNPELAAKPESKKAIEQMRGLLAGIAIRIDIASGMVVELGSKDRQTEISEFAWVKQIAPEEFAIDKQKWEDYSDDPTLGNPVDLLMISHNEGWQPGMKSGDSDGRLVDVGTGRYRRIPFQGISMLPGCFLKDRSRVIVVGLDGQSAALAPYEINLKTGENRRIGGDQLTGGQALMPALSPDGKTIAILYKKPDGQPLDSQIYLIDLASDTAKPLGKPHDMAFLSWLPDGQGLLLLKRESQDPSDLSVPRIDTVALMRMDGQTIRLVDGGMPVLLNDGKTVLFKGPGDQGWRTCDLNGKNVQPFSDGLATYMFPSPAPDGQRILWMQRIQGAAPVPTIILIGKNSGKPVIKAPGLWSLPAWR